MTKAEFDEAVQTLLILQKNVLENPEKFTRRLKKRFLELSIELVPLMARCIKTLERREEIALRGAHNLLEKVKDLEKEVLPRIRSAPDARAIQNFFNKVLRQGSPFSSRG